MKKTAQPKKRKNPENSKPPAARGRGQGRGGRGGRGRSRRQAVPCKWLLGSTACALKEAPYAACQGGFCAH